MPFLGGGIGSAKLLRGFVFILALGIAGCATVTPPPAANLPVPHWEASQLIESLQQRRAQIRSVRALAQVEYSGPDGKHSFQEAVIVQRPDELRLETLSFLGAIAIVTANRKEMVGYHPRDGVFVRGNPTKDNLRRYTQIPLGLEEITMLLVGLPPVDPKERPTQEGNSLVFSVKGGERDVVAFDSPQPVPTSWQRLGTDGKVELSAQFSDYISTSSGLFPTRVVFQANLQNKQVQIHYEQPEINTAVAPELFSQQIPADVQEVPIEALGS